MDYKMDDSIAQNKCLGEKCPNHCCSEKFIGLSKSLEYEDTISTGMPLLSKDEYERIFNNSGSKYIEMIDEKPYLKVYENNRCAAFENGKCMIYSVRPDVCKIYPFYFDQACGLCKDQNCPGNFTKNDITKEHYELLKKRIDLYQEELLENKK